MATIVPNPNFDVNFAVNQVREKLVEGEGLIYFLCEYSNKQRVEICKAYNSVYDHTIDETFKSILGKELLKSFFALTVPTAHYDAQKLHDSLNQNVVDVEKLIKRFVDIVISDDKNKIKDVKNAYMELYNTNLENDIKVDIDLRDIMVLACKGQRDESDYIGPIDTKKLAQELACKNIQLGRFADIIVNQNGKQLRKIIAEYELLSGDSITNRINEVFKYPASEMIDHIVRLHQNPIKFYSELLHAAIRTTLEKSNNDELIRIFMSHSEIDLLLICQEFDKNNRLIGGKSVISLIRKANILSSDFLTQVLKGNQHFKRESSA